MNQNPYFITGPALISFSGGRTSGYMLRHILNAHGGTLPDDIKVCFANTGREFPETLDFVRDCAIRWDVPITWLEYDPDENHKTVLVNHSSASRAGEPFHKLTENRNMLPNPLLRICTAELKIKRMKAFGRHWLGWSCWSEVVGLRADEPKRVAKMARRNAEGKSSAQQAVCPLAVAGVTKRDVVAWWRQQPFDLGLPTVNGTTPMGNCDLCFMKGFATLRGIARQRPEVLPWWRKHEDRALSRGRMRNPAMARFCADWSYADVAAAAQQQGDLLDIADMDGESVDCACTD